MITVIINEESATSVAELEALLGGKAIYRTPADMVDSFDDLSMVNIHQTANKYNLGIRLLPPVDPGDDPTYELTGTPQADANVDTKKIWRSFVDTVYKGQRMPRPMYLQLKAAFYAAANITVDLVSTIADSEGDDESEEALVRCEERLKTFRKELKQQAVEAVSGLKEIQENLKKEKDSDNGD